jgi:uncharacterized protein
MVKRLLNPLINNSFFLFGARGTGKSYLLQELFSNEFKERAVFYDLLDPDLADRLVLGTESFQYEVKKLSGKVDWVIIDEIQKVPKLLDVVHKILEEQERNGQSIKEALKFVLTGSSARKLKRGSANLLAGRAFVFNLFPFSFVELGDNFNLLDALQWGLLPKVNTFETNQEKKLFLNAYTNTYLKEEILQEQVIRRLEPFRRFLEVSAQTSGTIINYENIGRGVGATTKTVQSYYQILEDTLLGLILQPFHESIRKRQRSNPKFYFFDSGVERALTRSLETPLQQGSYAFGKAFESFVINEIHKLLHYKQTAFNLSYLRTKDDAEIDLIVERSGNKRYLIEIKSKKKIGETDLQTLIRFAKDMPESKPYCLSLDPADKIIKGVNVLYWRRGIENICD